MNCHIYGFKENALRNEYRIFLARLYLVHDSTLVLFVQVPITQNRNPDKENAKNNHRLTILFDLTVQPNNDNCHTISHLKMVFAAECLHLRHVNLTMFLAFSTPMASLRPACPARTGHNVRPPLFDRIHVLQIQGD